MELASFLWLEILYRNKLGCNKDKPCKIDQVRMCWCDDRTNNKHTHTKVFKYIDFMYIYSCG